MFNVPRAARRGTDVCFSWLVFNACIADLELATEGKDGRGGRSRRSVRVAQGWRGDRDPASPPRVGSHANTSFERSPGHALPPSPGMVMGRPRQAPCVFPLLLT